jgi:hypothetical protein
VTSFWVYSTVGFVQRLHWRRAAALGFVCGLLAAGWRQCFQKRPSRDESEEKTQGRQNQRSIEKSYKFVLVQKDYRRKGQRQTRSNTGKTSVIPSAFMRRWQSLLFFVLLSQ